MAAHDRIAAEPVPARQPYAEQWARRHPLVVDVGLALVLAAVLAPVSSGLVLAADVSTVTTAFLVAALVAVHASVVLRRTLPVTAYAVCATAMLVLVLSPDVPSELDATGAAQAVPPVLLPSAITYFVVLYATSAYASRSWPTVALAVAAVGAVITTVRLLDLPVVEDPVGLPRPLWGLVVLAALGAAVVAPWALGRYRRVHRAYVEALEERAARAEHDRRAEAARAVVAERSRIAGEMHDVVAHSLAVIVRQAEGARLVVASDPARAASAMAAVTETGRSALADVRGLLGMLDDERPAEAAPPGVDVPPAPQPTVDDVEALVRRVRTTGAAVDLQRGGDPVPLATPASLAAYRVVQEALTNAVRHAPGAAVVVRLDWDAEGLDVMVADDGGRRPPGRVAPDATGGRGLAGMRQRVELVGGRLDVVDLGGGKLGADGVVGGRSDGARGFVVRARFPRRDEPADDPAPADDHDTDGTDHDSDVAG